jgi:hypothetical protein
MPNLTCAFCGAIRPPNARFCPSCGAGYEQGMPRAVGRDTEFGMSIWAAIKLGAGFSIGAGIVGLAGTIVYLLGLAAVLDAAFR